MAGIGDYIHYYQAHYIKYGTNKEGVSNFAQASSIFEEQKAALKSKIESQSGTSDGKELENTLNAIYYPTDINNPHPYTERVQQIAQASIANRFNKWLILWEQGGGVVRSGTTGLGDSKGFHLSTLRSLKNELEAEIKRLSSNSDLSKSAEQVRDKIIKTSKTVNNLYKRIVKKLQLEADAERFLSYKELNVDKQILINPQTIAQINQALDSVGWYGKASATGDSFEAGLAGLDDSVTEYRDNIVDDLIENQILTGTQQSDFDGSLASFRFDSKITPPKPFQKTVKLMPEDDSSLSIKGSMDAATTTYKMDVKLTFRGENYRISAKNYQLSDNKVTLTSKTSPLLNILMRTGSNNFINHYLNVVSSHPGNFTERLSTTLLNQAHTAAQFSIAVEALTGSGQRQGYANYLVINGRTWRKIRVIPMITLINNIEEYVKIQGYPKDFTPYNRRVGHDNNTSERISNLLTKIHNIKIGATLNTTTFFKPE